MRDLFEDLCLALEGKLERQEAVVEVCRAQQRAIRAHDYEYVGAKTVELSEMSSANIETEAELAHLIQCAGRACGLPQHKLSLAALIRVSPDPYRTRLAEIEGRLREMYGELLRVSHASVMSMQRAAETIDQCMRSFVDCIASEARVSEPLMQLPEYPVPLEPAEEAPRATGS